MKKLHSFIIYDSIMFYLSASKILSGHEILNKNSIYSNSLNFKI